MEDYRMWDGVRHRYTLYKPSRGIEAVNAIAVNCTSGEDAA